MDSAHVVVQHFLPRLTIGIFGACFFYTITVLVFYCFFGQESKPRRIVAARHHFLTTVYSDIKGIEGYGWDEEVDSEGS